MSNPSPVFIGVEILPTAGRVRNSFVYAALDEDRELLAIGQGDRDELLAYLGGQASAIVAVSAPRCLKTGPAKLAEEQLVAQGFPLEPTPSALKGCPRWIRESFDLFERLEDFGYASYPNEGAVRQSLETRADAIFWRLLGDKLPLDPSLEGRLQRQLILADQELPVPDAMDFFMEITRFKLVQGELPMENIHTSGELNALAAALVAWLAGCEPDQIELLGDPNSATIALPAPSSKIL
nr:hypothetical protein [uncultured Hyphomonas sp.]